MAHQQTRPFRSNQDHQAGDQDNKRSEGINTSGRVPAVDQQLFGESFTVPYLAEEERDRPPPSATFYPPRPVTELAMTGKKSRARNRRRRDFNLPTGNAPTRSTPAPAIPPPITTAWMDDDMIEQTPATFTLMEKITEAFWFLIFIFTKMFNEVTGMKLGVTPATAAEENEDSETEIIEVPGWLGIKEVRVKRRRGQPGDDGRLE